MQRLALQSKIFMNKSDLLNELNSETIQDDVFWSRLFEAKKALKSEDLYLLLKKFLNSGVLEKHKINPYYALFLIDALNLDIEHVSHRSRYKYDVCVSPTQKNKYACSITSMYGQFVFAIRLLNYEIHRWTISPKSNIYNHGINVAKDDTLIDPKQLVVLDLETTGLNPITDDVIELAFYDLETKKEYSRLLPLNKQTEISGDITNLTGITNESVKGLTKLTSNDLDWIIKEFNLENKTILIWSGINMFDAHFLASLFFNTGNGRFNSLKFVSEMEILKHYKSGAFATYSKDYIAYRYGINVSNSHRALIDCKIEAEIYECLYKEFNNDGR